MGCLLSAEAAADGQTEGIYRPKLLIYTPGRRRNTVSKGLFFRSEVVEEEDTEGEKQEEDKEEERKKRRREENKRIKKGRKEDK